MGKYRTKNSIYLSLIRIIIVDNIKPDTDCGLSLHLYCPIEIATRKNILTL